MSERRATYGEGRDTEDKLDLFAALLNLHMTICSEKVWCPRYEYIDMNAGPGIAPQLQIHGSPLLFLDTIRRFKLSYHALMIEQDGRSAVELRDRIGIDDHTRVVQGDHALVVPQHIRTLAGQPAGIIHHDPNGLPSWDVLRDIFAHPQAKRLDLFMYCRTNDVRRVNGYRYNRGIPDITLPEGLAAIKKDYWLIRTPRKASCWTYIIGTNWPGFPEWRKNGVYRLESKEGQAILHNVTFRPKQPPELDQQAIPLELL